MDRAGIEPASSPLAGMLLMRVAVPPRRRSAITLAQSPGVSIVGPPNAQAIKHVGKLGRCLIDPSFSGKMNL
jgi:hypothetical protein